MECLSAKVALRYCPGQQGPFGRTTGITVITLTAPLSPSGRLRCLKVPEEDSIIVHVRIRRLGESIWSKGPFVFLIDSVQDTLELDWLGCQILVEESEIARGVCGKVDVYLEIS